MSKGRIHKELGEFLEKFRKFDQVGQWIVWKIRKNYIFGEKTQRSIHGIKNHLIYNYIHRELKEQNKEKKIVHEERERMTKLSKNNLIYALKSKSNVVW